MGKWAKGHLKPKYALNPIAGMKGLSSALKDDISPDVPGESPEETAIRNRQALELAKLDEEENRRIKSMFAGGGGRKLFRSARSSKGGSAKAASPGTPTASAPSGYGVRTGGFRAGLLP